MYRYKCTAAENAGKQDFYDVIGQLREMYPELTEDSRIKSDNEFLRREFVRGKNRVMVQYSYSEQSVTVYSEEWLEKFYGERKVEEVQFPMRRKAGAGTMWAVSGIYFAIIALLTFTIFMIEPDIFGTDIPIVPILILAVVNTLAGIIIRRLTEIDFLNRILCQAVGFVTAWAVLTLIVAFTFGNWGELFGVFLIIVVFFLPRFFLLAFVISLLLQGVTELIIKAITNQRKGRI